MLGWVAHCCSWTTYLWRTSTAGYLPPLWEACTSLFLHHRVCITELCESKAGHWARSWYSKGQIHCTSSKTLKAWLATLQYPRYRFRLRPGSSAFAADTSSNCLDRSPGRQSPPSWESGVSVELEHSQSWCSLVPSYSHDVWADEGFDTCSKNYDQQLKAYRAGPVVLEIHVHGKIELKPRP